MSYSGKGTFVLDYLWKQMVRFHVEDILLSKPAYLSVLRCQCTNYHVYRDSQNETFYLNTIKIMLVTLYMNMIHAANSAYYIIHHI